MLAIAPACRGSEADAVRSWPQIFPCKGCSGLWHQGVHWPSARARRSELAQDSLASQQQALQSYVFSGLLPQDGSFVGPVSIRRLRQGIGGRVCGRFCVPQTQLPGETARIHG